MEDQEAEDKAVESPTNTVNTMVKWEIDGNTHFSYCFRIQDIIETSIWINQS